MSFDLQKIITSTPFNFPWSKYKGEFHLLGHSFTGPGTRLDLRLDENNKPLNNSKPVNKIDEAALKHDLIYRDSLDLETRHNADIQMINELKNIENPSFKEKVERAIIIKALQAKLKLGMGIKDEADLETRTKYANEIHKQYLKPKHLLKVKVFAKDSIWSADLINMPNEKGFVYCLTVIDLYTRFAWVEPLKNKKGMTVKLAFEKIFKESNRKPLKLWTDAGTEFFNIHVKPLFRKVYSTQNFGKAVIIERFNRTLKNKMFKEFTIQNNKKWLELLPSVVEKYNNKIHSSIGISPQDASDKPEEISEKTFNNNYYNEINLPSKKPKYKLDQRVRIFKYKKIFEKGYVGYWTDEVFKIEKINQTSPLTYELKDLDDEDIIGRFYENELQKTDF